MHACVRSFLSAFEAGDDAPETFDGLALDIARFQSEFVDPVKRIVRARGVDCEGGTRARRASRAHGRLQAHARVRVRSERDACHAPHERNDPPTARAPTRFRTLETYDAGAVAFGRRALLHGMKTHEGRVPIVVIGPSAQGTSRLFAHPHASICSSRRSAKRGRANSSMPSKMACSIRVARRTHRAPHEHSYSRGCSCSGPPFASCIFDALDSAPFRLPTGSPRDATGGYKGRSRRSPPPGFRRDLAAAFVPTNAIGAEYGMTELSSQFYESRF